jgi:hypothetical protein
VEDCSSSGLSPSPGFMREVLVHITVSATRLSRTRRYSIRALGLGWCTCCGRPAPTRDGLPPPHVVGVRDPSACRLDGGKSLLPRRPQERLRTWPSLACLARVEQEGVWVHKPDQVGRIQIPLHLDATRRTGVDAQRQRFLFDAATLTGLRQFGRTGAAVGSHDRVLGPFCARRRVPPPDAC